VWRETGLTIMFVTHNVREAVRLGQRIILLSSRPGRVLQEWQVGSIAGRQIGDPEVADLAREITDALRSEIARHAH
jgi:NitT/TauT family transport system ATP-binding protein